MLPHRRFLLSTMIALLLTLPLMGVQTSEDPIWLTEPFPDAVDAVQFRLVPNSQYVIFQSLDIVDDRSVNHLYTVPVDGSEEPIRLDPETDSIDADIGTVAISPSGEWVVFRVREEDTNSVWTYAAPSDGSSEAVIVDFSLNAGNIYRGDIVFTPDESRILLERNTLGEAAAPQLYASVFDGTEDAVLLSDAVGMWVLSPDGQTVAFTLTQPAGLYTVAIDGAEPPIRLGTETEFHSIAFTPDSQTVVYPSGSELNPRSDLFRVPADGSSDPVQINRTLGDAATVRLQTISADGAWVAFSVYREALDYYELFVVPIDGAPSDARLVAREAALIRFEFSPDSSALIYQRNRSPEARSSVRTYPLIDDESARTLFTTEETTDTIEAVQFSQDGQQAAIYVSADGLLNAQIWTVPIDGNSEPLQLNPGADDIGGATSAISVLPDSETVVFALDPQQDARLQIFSVPLDGSEPPMQIAVIDDPTRTTNLFNISDDGRWLVFNGRPEDRSEGTRLYSQRLE